MSSVNKFIAVASLFTADLLCSQVYSVAIG